MNFRNYIPEVAFFLSFRPSYYLRIPVYFSPQEAGKHYEATVAFENIKSGETLDVKLRANSVWIFNKENILVFIYLFSMIY